MLTLFQRLLQTFRRLFSRPTIAPYDELKKLVMEGKAVPYPTNAAAPWQPIHTWSEIMQISEPLERYLKMGEFVSMKGVKEGYDVLTDSERVVYQVWMLETEVNNGGFDQYFFNSAGNYALETLETLRMIGSVETADLLEEAVKVVFGEESPDYNREARWEQMETLPEQQKEQLNQLDRRFFQLDEPLFELVVNHLGDGD